MIQESEDLPDKLMDSPRTRELY